MEMYWKMSTAMSIHVCSISRILIFGFQVYSEDTLWSLTTEAPALGEYKFIVLCKHDLQLR